MNTGHPDSELSQETVEKPILYYDPEKVGLSAWARSTFGIDHLEDLHLLPDPVPFENYVDRLYYRVNQLKDRVMEIAEALQYIKEEIVVPVVGEIERFQFPPSIRCHLSGAGTASAFHKDGEAKYGVTANSLNLWIPLTKVWGNNSIHIEQNVDAGNFKPVVLEPGQILLFDAYHLTHGSFANDTIASRVSLDIRFVPKDITIARKLNLYARTLQQ